MNSPTKKYGDIDPGLGENCAGVLPPEERW